MERFFRRGVPVAIGVFAFSALIGAIAGVSFGAIVVRALLTGVLLGAGSVGVMIVAERLLPGLFDSEGSGIRLDTDSEAASDGTGGTVDIVVDDDGEAEYADFGTDRESGAGMVEEVHEESADIGAMTDEVAAEDGGHGRFDVAAGSLDEMPDIGAFASSFVSTPVSTAPAAADDDESENVFEPAFPEEASANDGKVGSGGPNDPAHIAKAIRTMLKRDNR